MLIFVFLWLFQAPPEADFDAVMQQGLAALNRNDLATAQAKLEAASRLHPRDPQVWLGLAQTYLKSNKKKDAEIAAHVAESFGGNDPRMLHALSIYYAETQNFAKAAALESRYAAEAPGDRQATLRAVELYRKAGQPKIAIALASKVLAGDDRADLHDLLGKAYEADGQSGRAVLELQHAIRLNPYEESYYFDLGQLLLEHQNFDAAIQTLEAGRKVFDKSAQIELALGVAYYGQRRFPDAVNSFLRTIELAPGVEQPYVFLGRILDQADARLVDIRQRFAQYAAANPKSYLGHFLYGKALIAESGKPDEAEASLRRSIALNDGYWESHFELGVLLERKWDFTGAARELERSIKLNPKSPVPHYRLARVYDRMGQPARAKEERARHGLLLAEEKGVAEKRPAGVKRIERR